MNIWVPVTISDVEVICHDYCVFNIPDVIILIAIKVYVDDEVDILFIVKVEDIDIMMVYYIFSEREFYF